MSKHRNVLTAMGFDIEVIEVDGKDFLKHEPDGKS